MIGNGTNIISIKSNLKINKTIMMKILKSTANLFIFLAVFAIHSQETSLVKNFTFTNIGPSIMSGRVVDLDVNPKKPTEFYVAYASGGLWHTANNGTSFTPVMDNSPTQNIGDIAVDWEKGTIWVGTGENNSSRSSYAGIGILKSNDRGKSWQNVGLTDSHHVSRILINPKNSDEVVIGVIGHLYTPNTERGIFKTKDGGKTWEKTLYINSDTGIIDVQMVPGDFNTMYASAWERERKAWNFKGSGEHSAIYKSVDAGNSWEKISNENSGFPTGKGLGRIGLAAFDNETVYAILDNQDRREKEEDDDDDNSDQLRKEDFKQMDQSNFLKLDDKKLNGYLLNNGFPKKHTAKSVKKMVKEHKIKPSDLAKYLENANSSLFDTPVKGAEVYMSTDGGKTWRKTHEKYVDNLYYSYGYYFGHIYVSPNNKDHIYIYGVPILSSKDGGKTFKSIGKANVHADHHALWINPELDGHLINGNDGGVNITYDDGETWIKNNQPEVGQFYTVNADTKKNYTVYGGLQDNGVWKGSGNYKASTRWHQSGAYPYKSIMGGDGMQVEIDNRHDSIVYTGFQFGYYYRVNTATNKSKSIQPKHELGENPYRFNWQTPILLSSHNQDILYLGSNKLHRSMQRGDNFVAISDDLTKGGIKGNVPYGTLSTISESPFQFGLLYVGSDDGLIHVSKDGGGKWTEISKALPQNLWVSRVIASEHKKERVYATLNGYRNDDFKAYVYLSNDYGVSWKQIGENLPESCVNVIKEDPEDEQILYLGNDQEALVSFDMGSTWSVIDKTLPKVAVHDLVVQNQAKDLIIGTHGRSIYKLNIAFLQKYNSYKKKDIEIAVLESERHSNRWGNVSSSWSKPREPEMKISYYSNQGGDMLLQVTSEENIVLNEWNITVDRGFNFETFDLSFSDKGYHNFIKKNKKTKIKKRDNGKFYLPKGKYKVSIEGSSQQFEVTK